MALNPARRLCTIGWLKRFGICTPTAVMVPLAILAVSLPGCDPVINIAGADFPSWLICLIAGAVLTAVVRPIFLKLRLEAYMGPLLVIYLSLAVLLACITYLTFFNRI
jgi:hypothetical protein